MSTPYRPRLINLRLEGYVTIVNNDYDISKQPRPRDEYMQFFIDSTEAISPFRYLRHMATGHWIIYSLDDNPKDRPSYIIPDMQSFEQSFQLIIGEEVNELQKQ
jgi:hypothetical protein